MDKKIVAMIPARVHSCRIHKKNFRYLGDKLLIEYIIDTCKNTGMFDSIYINSPDDMLQEIAEKNDIEFYKRDRWVKKIPETNDDFTSQFLMRNGCDICLLANPTSPFLSVNDFYSFLDFMLQGGFDTVLTVKDVRVQCLYGNKFVNCKQNMKMVPTQSLLPVRVLANGIMGWVRDSYLKRFKRYGFASLGYGGRTGFFPLYGRSTVDIDWEEDIQLAEQILKTTKKDEKYYEK